MCATRTVLAALGLLVGLLKVMTVAAAEPAAAETPTSPHTFSANLGLYSEYVFRGIANSNEGPAVQGGFDYTHSAGFYAGVWASNIEFGGSAASATAAVEVDFYAGYTATFSTGIGWDVGMIYYAYPSQNEDVDADYNYYEGYGKLNYSWAGLKFTPSLEVGLYYSPKYFGEDGAAVYTYGTLGATLAFDFAPYITLGYQYVAGDHSSGPAGFDYVHYALGMSKTIGIFTADLSWQDARDLSGCDETCAAVVFSVSSSW